MPYHNLYINYKFQIIWISLACSCNIWECYPGSMEKKHEKIWHEAGKVSMDRHSSIIWAKRIYPKTMACPGYGKMTKKPVSVFTLLYFLTISWQKIHNIHEVHLLRTINRTCSIAKMVKLVYFAGETSSTTTEIWKPSWARTPKKMKCKTWKLRSQCKNQKRKDGCLPLKDNSSW